MCRQRMGQTFFHKQFSRFQCRHVRHRTRWGPNGKLVVRALRKDARSRLKCGRDVMFPADVLVRTLALSYLHFTSLHPLHTTPAATSTHHPPSIAHHPTLTHPCHHPRPPPRPLHPHAPDPRPPHPRPHAPPTNTTTNRPNARPSAVGDRARSLLEAWSCAARLFDTPPPGAAPPPQRRRWRELPACGGVCGWAGGKMGHILQSAQNSCCTLV